MSTAPNYMAIMSAMTDYRRSGRPKSGESAWGAYIEAAQNPAIRFFGREAERRELSMRHFAKMVGVDLRVFQRYFNSQDPASKTIERVAKALGYPARVARALIDRLTPEDVYLERMIISGDIDMRGEMLFGGGLTVYSIPRVGRTKMQSRRAKGRMRRKHFVAIQYFAKPTGYSRCSPRCSRSYFVPVRLLAPFVRAG